ncbi:MAG: hypothetical protein NT166_04595 [Candidatus Aminicenantes bacterium]|nr:hypothetical protein [Candidatus Aminicenantes bacterium]
MSDWQEFFIRKSFQTFDHFQEEVEERIDIARSFLKYLDQAGLKDGEDISQSIKEIQEWVETSSYSSFSINCLYFYRWLIAKGYEDFEDSEIDLFFKFLDTVGVTDFAATQVNWGVTFLVRGNLDGSIEHFWENNIFKYFSLTQKDLFTFNQLINHFMVYHIGLKQLINDEEKELTETQYVVLNNYMTLVNRFPQLEEVFGVIIEKDVFRVYSLLRNEEKKREKNK